MRLHHYSFLSAAEFYASEEEADAVILDIDIPDEKWIIDRKKTS